MKGEKFEIRNKKLILPAIIALGFGLRLYRLASESLWYDELLQLDIAQGPLNGIFPRLRGHSGVPLDYLMAHFWILLGRSDAWVRIPAVVWGTLTLPLAYQLGKSLLGPAEGLLLMGLLALSPFHIRYSQEVRPYALVVLGVVLTGYAYWRLRETGRWRYLIPLQIGMLVSWLAHIFTTTVFGVLAVFAITDLIFNQERRTAARLLAGLLATGLIPLAILLALGWGDLLFYTSRGFGEALVEPEKFTLDASQKPNRGTGPEVTWTFVEDEIVAPLGTGEAIASLVLGGIAGLGVVYLLREKQLKLGFLLLMWVVLPAALIIAFLIFRGTFFAPRYILPVLPAYLILLATGILALPRWLKGRGADKLSTAVFVVVAGLVVVSLTGQLDRYYREKDKEDWRLVANFISSNAGPNDTVIAFHAEPTMNWYYPPAGAAPNFFRDLASIQRAVANAGRSWVILSIFSSGNDAKVKAWLGEQGAVRFVLDPLIHVYYLGHNVARDQLLEEIRAFALPADHALYASLARENRRRPEVARQYYQLAIEHAPNGEIRAEYQAALEALTR